MIVEGIFVAPRRDGAPHPRRRRPPRSPARGIEGDRYFAGDGTFYEDRKPGQDLTLIEAEAIEGLAREDGIELSPARRGATCVTRGIGLNDLVGRRFRWARSSASAAACASRAATSRSSPSPGC